MVSLAEIQDITHRIVEEFHPRRVILFGSHARGRADEDSDVDLLVEMNFEGSSFRQAMEILNRLNMRLPIDLLARRPEDVQSRYEEGDPLIREALDRGRTLYNESNR